ncbi:MAG: coiled-coil domain-containing protein [Sarcina sp.]
MNKKILSLLMVLGISFNTCTVVLATPEQAIEENTIKFKQLDNEIMDLNTQISNLNSEIHKLNDKLNENKTNMDNTEVQIKDTENQISEVEKKVKKSETILGKRMRALYKNGQASSPLAIIISSEDMGDFFSRISAVARILTLDKEVIKELDLQKNTLKNAKNSLDSKKIELEKLQQSTENDIKNLNQKHEEQKTSLNKLNEEKTKVASVIEENENLLVNHPISVITSSNP